ncbi:hypothetical protein GCM10023261_03460 [Bartonella jaculi]|uniref:Uncharacterized protein n=1 Tax=Bartonella jaculi TaxID=686226 RepID=A0ABP9N2Z9_9HYPH
MGFSKNFFLLLENCEMIIILRRLFYALEEIVTENTLANEVVLSLWLCAKAFEKQGGNGGFS